MVKFRQCSKKIIDGTTYISSYPNIYTVINKARSQLMQQKFHRRFFSNFEPIHLKYLKYLQSGRKFELGISNDMWLHVFRSKFGSYIFIFLFTCLDYILFLSYVTIFHWIRRWEGVGIYRKLIPGWIESTQAIILFPAQYRTEIHNQIRNTTWRSI